jgi:3-deoxy-D-manno-octulosonic-acid transferase
MLIQKPYIWLHVASLGDLKATLSLQSYLSHHYHLYISTVTSSGQIGLQSLTQKSLTQSNAMIAESNLIPKSAPIFHPLAPYFAYQKLPKDQKPIALILEYLEVWPHWVWTWHRLGLKIIVVDAKITDRTMRFRCLLKPFFRQIDLFLAQSDRDAQYAQLLGVRESSIHTIGFGKYDSILLTQHKHKAIHDNNTSNPHREILLTVGCLAIDEEDLLIDHLIRFYQENMEWLKGQTIYIAPRQIQRVKQIERKLKQSLQSNLLTQTQMIIIRKSQLEIDPEPFQKQNLLRIILLDRYGELESIYKQSKYALIAGSFGKRNGQNLIEAMSQGAYLFVGPRSQKIETEKQLLRQFPKLGQEVGQMIDVFHRILDFEKEKIDSTPSPTLIDQALQSLLGASNQQAQIICASLNTSLQSKAQI